MSRKYTARVFVERYGFLKLRSRAVVWLYERRSRNGSYILQLKDMDNVELEASPYKLKKMIIAISERPTSKSNPKER